MPAGGASKTRSKTRALCALVVHKQVRAGDEPERRLVVSAEAGGSRSAGVLPSRSPQSTAKDSQVPGERLRVPVLDGARENASRVTGGVEHDRLSVSYPRRTRADLPDRRRYAW